MEPKSTQKVISIKDRYLTFYLENEKYGVEILSVKEIIGFQKTVHVPRAPIYVVGVMNLRGQIIPIVDMRLKLNMPQIEPKMETAIVIVNIGKLNVGFIVDKVEEVASISENELSEPPKFGSKVATEFIKYMANTKGGVIMIINLDKIFNSQDLEKFATIASKEIQNQL